VDLDGWEDLLVCNGVERAARDHDVVDYLTKLRASRALSDAEIFQARRRFPRQATANLAFRNRGDLTFDEVSAAWGFDLRAVSSSLALADLDNDGDLDVVVNNFNGPVAVYRNNCAAPRVAVRLRGLPPNTRGIGARILVRGGPGGPQAQEIQCGGRYLASDDPIRTFAAGAPTNRLEIEILWRSGRRSLVREALPDQLYEIDEAAARQEQTTRPAAVSTDELPKMAGSGSIADDTLPITVPSAPLFADVSYLLHHVHAEEPFDDFARQPLLPNKLSQLGPGISWFDLNGDGWDDLIIPSGRGGQLAVFENDGRGAFTRLNQPPFTHRISRDQTTVLGWHRAPDQVTLLVGTANYEDGLSTVSPVRAYDLTGRSVADELPGQPTSVGPLALADYDGDGDVDLFVGGRVVPGRYPEPASSRLFRNDGGKLRADEQAAKLLDRVGLVSAALWSDLTGDGWPELVLACEWGPIRIFRNDRGELQPWDPPLARPVDASARPSVSALRDLTGWWNGVASGDFDEDGRLDLAVSNWGRNTKYEPFRSRPLQMFYGDFTGDGAVTLVEAAFDPGLQKSVPLRQFIPLARAWPALRARFTSHAEYARVSVEELLGDHLAAAKRLHAAWLESTVFLNRGEGFEIRSLPAEAQWAPAFGLCVGDADGDGHDDLFLAQNFFAVQPETPRYDAGRGLWL
ncbi:MAG: VCBS repeat-containing protein, partial [Verrucomicrobiales bacterium]|nr:VCBS repeat-containing protein [Verrucomicrobiales bacterium]